MTSSTSSVTFADSTRVSFPIGNLFIEFHMASTWKARWFRITIRDVLLIIALAGVLLTWWQDRRMYTGMSTVGGAGRKAVRRLVTGNLLVTFVIENEQRKTGQRIKDVAVIEFYPEVVLITRHNGEGRMLRLSDIKDFTWKSN